jgi:hypothetical protein
MFCEHLENPRMYLQHLEHALELVGEGGSALVLELGDERLLRIDGRRLACIGT